VTAEHTKQGVFSRRSLIKGIAGLGGGLVVASFANLFGIQPGTIGRMIPSSF